MSVALPTIVSVAHLRRSEEESLLLELLPAAWFTEQSGNEHSIHGLIEGSLCAPRLWHIRFCAHTVRQGV